MHFVVIAHGRTACGRHLDAQPTEQLTLLKPETTCQFCLKAIRQTTPERELRKRENR